MDLCCIVTVLFCDFLFFFFVMLWTEKGQVFTHAVIQHCASVVFLLPPVSAHLFLLSVRDFGCVGTPESHSAWREIIVLA